MLDHLLLQIRQQVSDLQDLTGGDTRIIVADNDPDCSARAVVANHPDVQYESVKTPGIAAARAACLAAATGDVLQFIDDDEEPQSDWLLTMVGCWLVLGKPTAMAGSVLTKFDTPPSPWITAGRFFERPRPITGTLRAGAAAGNLLINLREVKRLGVTFDARLGLGGGEDTLFTRQLIASGGQIRFCREGVVYDLVPDERNTREWVLRRAWHHGNTTSVVSLWGLRGPIRWLEQGRLAVSGLGRFVVGLSFAALGSVSRSLARNASGWRMAKRGLGMLSGSLRRAPGEYSRINDEGKESLNGPLFSRRLGVALDYKRDGSGREFGIVVVNYGASELLRSNLPYGLGEAADAHIIVVDNFSTEVERESVRLLALDRGWSLVEPEENLGFGNGVNAGVLRGAELGCKTFITLNPDAFAESEVLKTLARAATLQPNALISPFIVDSDGAPRFSGSTVSMKTGRIRTGWIAPDVDPEWKNWLTGACIGFSGRAFVRLGGFSGEYFLYWEDVDLSRRAANLGMELVVRHDLRVVHDEGGTHTAPKSRSMSGLYYYYNTRNRLLFGARMAPKDSRAQWILSTPRESMMIWLRGGRRQLLTHPAGIVATIRGSMDGLLLYGSNQCQHDE